MKSSGNKGHIKLVQHAEQSHNKEQFNLKSIQEIKPYNNGQDQLKDKKPLPTCFERIPKIKTIEQPGTQQCNINGCKCVKIRKRPIEYDSDKYQRNCCK